MKRTRVLVRTLTVLPTYPNISQFDIGATIVVPVRINSFKTSLAYIQKETYCNHGNSRVNDEHNIFGCAFL